MFQENAATQQNQSSQTSGGNPQTEDQETSSQQSQNGNSSSSSSQNNDIEILQKELADSKFKLQELQNFKRRAEEEKISFIHFANANFILELLPALDNAHRALEHAPEDPKLQEWVNGATATLKQFETLFKEKGLKTIETTNQSFNPEYHEALLVENGPKNIIMKELEKGYLLNERVLRRAKVSVGNGEITEEKPE
jgi:molecular chaperone GrpE